jgi:hypothetical protein
VARGSDDPAPAPDPGGGGMSLVLERAQYWQHVYHDLDD